MLEGVTAADRYEARTEQIRVAAARLMGVSPTEVAFVKNTTEGLSFVANGLDWSPGDRVVVPDHEFPSTIYPFLALERLGVEVERVQPEGPHGALTLDAFEQAITGGRTRLVVLSWVQYATGWRTDLAALADLCHRHEALLCVDVIQALGLLPCHLDEWGVDIATADAHKWMLGPQGVGVFYIASRHLDRLRISEPGWNSVAHRDDFDRLELDLDPTARRFEGGTHNYTGIATMGASVDLLLDAGLPEVWRHVDDLCTHAREQLTDLGARIVTTPDPDHRAGILTFRLDGPIGVDLWRHLEDNHVVCAPRGGGIRLSPHGWNSTDDLDRVSEVLRALS